jgi:hypothetical protein
LPKAVIHRQYTANGVNNVAFLLTLTSAFKLCPGEPQFTRAGQAAKPAISERVACSFGLRKGTDEFNKGSADWFLFDREKTAHKGGAVTSTEERYDGVLW